MDPFSIAAGASSLLDLGWKVTKYLRDVQQGASHIEADIANLLHEVESLEAVNKAIKHLHENEIEGAPEGYLELPDRDRELWWNTARDLEKCQVVVETLYAILETISGKNGRRVSSCFDGIKKQLRKQSMDSELNQIHVQLSTRRGSLQLCLTMLNMIYAKKGSRDVQKLGFRLHNQIASMHSRMPLSERNSLGDSLKFATVVASSLSLNEHFDPPKSVSSIFTGRRAYLDGLKSALDTSFNSLEAKVEQKRFVVFGLGGSGKTQFCCKFASDNKHRFWGVFTVDASSPETAQQSFVTIARFCKIDPNERAAKSWLSSSERPWLLLIDNADDSKLEIERYFPDGDQGLILITTRDPSISKHGTIGQRFYHFDRLAQEEASELLLRAAGHLKPQAPSILQLASTISKALGALPLALIHAGNAIRARYCGLGDYLEYYDRNWKMIRQHQRLTKHHANEGHADEYLEVYSSYEILYRGLESMKYERFKDAIQLLRIFSFLHHENIAFEILIAAVKHPRIEREAQVSQAKIEVAKLNHEYEAKGASWGSYLWTQGISLLEFVLKDRSSIVLPTFLRDSELFTCPDDCNVRLRKALGELTRLSLVNHHEVSDSYSMHPLVHTWVRERPEMSTRDQAIWCEAATSTISRCILLPPLSNTVESHAELPRKVLPHLIAIAKCQERIREDFRHNSKTMRRPWPRLLRDEGLTMMQALRTARASLVYAQCGYFSEAETCQRSVMEYVYKMRGPHHPRAMEITLALADTLLHQSRANEAADLQEHVYEGCLKTLGSFHPRKWKVMAALGQSRRFQGRFTESIDLFEEAITGMKQSLPETDINIYHSMEHLGVTLWYCLRYEEAKERQQEAVKGLTSILGQSHIKTLEAIESLAVTRIDLGRKLLATDKKLGLLYLEGAREDLLFVVAHRTTQLGDKQPYTWLAKCNLAKAEAALGNLDVGEQIIHSLLPMAASHLGEDHIGVLAGKNHLAKIMAEQGRYQEAETIFIEITKPEKYFLITNSTGDHPDRFMALWNLSGCYRQWGKYDDSLRVCDELSAAILALRKRRNRTETSSTFFQMVEDRRQALQAYTNSRNSPLLLGSKPPAPQIQTGLSADRSDGEFDPGGGNLRRRGRTENETSRSNFNGG
ncbi:hypothetical protein BJ875DRAFT_470717 [Amylocarpus encephaloides]|uniref:NB-ARC domain-containing protein n=1 Tax=Amylocarpus encephaloides TaxID=45428 RepID=A0A9P8C3H2_9HELO|nr:hypothetical protein BJ875DRAFT_470717 [Amylocarpus encephaloides]